MRRGGRGWALRVLTHFGYLGLQRHIALIGEVAGCIPDCRCSQGRATHLCEAEMPAEPLGKGRLRLAHTKMATINEVLL